jgi:DNA repair exonuclease SbcCD ATPase subunit
MTDNTMNNNLCKPVINQEIKWSQASLELKKALDEWQTVSETLSETQRKLSPDEKMLADMQKLLLEIKSKLTSLETMYENKECSNAESPIPNP